MESGGQTVQTLTMAKRTRSEEIPETDRIEGFAHPRETTRLVGQDEALARVSRAIRSGRPPQAWLALGKRRSPTAWRGMSWLMVQRTKVPRILPCRTNIRPPSKSQLRLILVS